MSKNQPRIRISFGVAASLMLLSSIQSAEAFHGRFLSVQGAHGHGFVAGRTINRVPGSVTATRGVETNNGRGFQTNRQTTYGNGSVNNAVTRTYNNGETATRTGSITRNPDGSVTAERSHTGVNGNTQSGWNTIYRNDNGFTDTRGFTTSSGASASQTTTYTRGN